MWGVFLNMKQRTELRAIFVDIWAEFSYIIQAQRGHNASGNAGRNSSVVYDRGKVLKEYREVICCWSSPA
jgi:hypothetical protein